MSKENLNQNEESIEDIFEDETTEDKPTEGEGTEDKSPKLSNDALAEYNEQTGKNFKSWDDVVKSQKEADKAFAKGKHKEVKTVAPSINDEVVEELLLTKHPEAEYILDELKETARETGKSVLKLYRESKYFQGEAKAIAEDKRIKEENISKINKPSTGAVPSKTDFSKIKSDEDVAKLSTKEKVAFFNHQASIGK